MKNFLAIFIGSPTAAPMEKWNAIPEAQRREIEGKGMKAWGEWMHERGTKGQLVFHGGPLGKTKKVDNGGISDTRNTSCGFVVVQAESHEAAARLFEGHPHFAIFPGEAVEIMEVLPIPGTEGGCDQR